MIWSMTTPNKRKNETGKFVLLSEKKRLAEGTSEIEAVQFGQDSYTGIEYNE